MNFFNECTIAVNGIHHCFQSSYFSITKVPLLAADDAEDRTLLINQGTSPTQPARMVYSFQLSGSTSMILILVSVGGSAGGTPLIDQGNSPTRPSAIATIKVSTEVIAIATCASCPIKFMKGCGRPLLFPAIIPAKGIVP